MKTSEHVKIYHKQELSLDQEGQHLIINHQGVDLTRQAVDKGFLKYLPGSQLPVYLYLVTHIDSNFALTASSIDIASLLPDTPIQVEKALKQLESQGYISLRETEETNIYYITIQKIPGSPENTSPVKVESGVDLSSDAKPSPMVNETVAYILKQKVFSEEDLVRAIAAMVPPQQLNLSFRQEIDYWFKIFEKGVIKELIRRTEEARQREMDLNCQAYMRKVANEWIQEQILTLTDLDAADQIFRETRSLIEEFGIDRQREMTRTHLETVYNWISTGSGQDFAVSIEVARLAIQEAIRRKSDGRPSLAYIEDNFIKPWKENRLKTVEEAKEFLLKQKTDKPASSNTEKYPQNTKPENKYKWQTGTDFTRFRKN